MQKVDEISSATDYEKRSRELLGRLKKLLRPDIFRSVSGLPYNSLSRLEKWHTSEEARLSDWMSALGESSKDLSDLGAILNSVTPDIQELSRWCSDKGLDVPIAFLVQLFSEGKRIGVSENMSQRGKTKRKNTAPQHKKLGERWLQLQYDDPGRYGKRKNKAALKLYEEFGGSYDYIYKLLCGSHEPSSSLFPDGIENAKMRLGLPPHAERK